MTPQFSNMNEMLTYLETLEKRLVVLERQRQDLESQKETLNHYIQEMGGDAQKLLPKTSLLAPNFLQRAFAVWGHYFVAQLIISIPITCIYFIFVFFLLQEGISLPGLPTP